MPGDAWLRVTGYHETIAGALDRHALDDILPARPLRVQHQTGALWMLNSLPPDLVDNGSWPDGTEFDPSGIPTGRFFREEAWLRNRVGADPPDMSALGCILAKYGITGVTDANVNNGAGTAALLRDAVRARKLSIRLTLMSGGRLDFATDGAYAVGPVKILLDDDRLPPVDDVVAIIRRAREWGRTVAAHCVTAGELAVMLAALDESGSRPGDRIEHGSVIPPEAIPVLKDLRLAVVTQSGFVFSRGDRYLENVDAADQPDLYRSASLLNAGISVAGSSDSPYGNFDPWQAMQAAISRRTAQGRMLGQGERLSPGMALDLYLSPQCTPAGPPRRLHVGGLADICVLGEPLEVVLRNPQADKVVATIARGDLVYRA